MKIRMLRTGWSIALVLAVLLCPVLVKAEGNSYCVSIPVSVSNPKNNIPKDNSFTIVIEGPPHAPLPDPAQLIVDVNDTTQFNTIEFTEPGTYRYVIKQEASDNARLITDTKQYVVLVTVIREDSGELQGGFTIQDGTEDGKPDYVSFVNDYRRANSDSGSHSKNGKDSDDPSKDEKSPGTGEPLPIAFGGLLLSGVLFLVFLIVRKIRTKPEVQPYVS